MHLNSELAFRARVLPRLRDARSVLEMGPDDRPSTFERLAARPGLLWETADLDQPGRAVEPDHTMPNEYVVPVPDGTFDVVLAGQVIEHVRRVWDWVPELARVVRPGGLVALIGPVSWPYHEAPVDCWRIYPEGMRTLCEHASLVVEHCAVESLEPAPGRRTYWGTTADERFRPLKRFLGWPMPVAVDVVTLARRPS